MIREEIMQIAQSDPRFTQAVEAMERAVINMPIVPEDLDDAIEILELIVQDPNRYAEIREAAIADGEIDEDVLPAQFDPIYVVSLLVALYGLQDRLKEKGFARGGLSVAARRMMTGGRGGDSELVHVNRREAEMLRRAGGSGGINPNTGLREYRFRLGNILKAVLPVALSFIAPGIGTAIGSAISGGLGLGLGAVGSGILGSAAIGAGLGALSGGKDALRGAAMGAIGGGLGGQLGQLAGLTGPAANILGTSALGAGLAGVTGRNPLSGALRGAIGAGVGELAGVAAGQVAGGAQGSVGRGISAAGTGFGSALAGGMDPRAAAIAGGLSGLAAGMIAPRPSQAVVDNMQGDVPLATPVQQPDGTLAPAPGSRGVMPDGRPGTYQLNPQTGMIDLRPVQGAYGFNPQTNQVEFQPQQQQPGVMDAIRTAIGMPAATPTTAPAGGQQGGGGLSGLLGGNMAPLLLGGALLAGQSGGSQQQPPPPGATRSLTPAQQEYINRPSITWDWARLQRDAAASGTSLDQFIATNWPRVTAGEYNVQRMAEGGLSAVSRFVRGGGTGRSDEIPAKLSDGEYVIDAETVAMLGDGSSKAGAQRLDEMREKIRQHKGKTLARGKFSPNAKSPLTYLKGVA